MTEARKPLCIHCGLAPQREHGRRLCSKCYRNLDIRLDYPTVHGRMPAEDLISEMKFFAESGLTLTEAVGKIGKSEKSIYKSLHRHDRLDVWNTLADREPDVENRRRGRVITPRRIEERQQRAAAKAARLAKVGG